MDDKDSKVLYPELSYKIVGCLFEVYRNTGSNHQEKIYQKALKEEFISQKINFAEQVPCEIIYKDKIIGKHYIDFLIENRIILEIKAGQYFRKRDFKQVLQYLKTTKLKLAIMAIFSPKEVKFYRVINL